MKWEPPRTISAPMAALAYLAGAVLATYPLAFNAQRAVLPSPDTQLNLWALGWVVHQLPRAPLSLFDGNTFFPYPRSLAFSEHLFLPALLASPLVAATDNLVLAHNVVLLASLALAGLGMFLLCRELTGSTTAAFGAGLLYAFHTWNINELVRIQTVSNQWFPFLLLALLRYFRQPTAGRCFGAGAAYLAQSLSCMYWALYLPFVTAAATIFLAWRCRPQPRRLVPLLVCLLGAQVLATPFLVPYLRNASALGLERAAPEALPPSRYLDVLPGNLLYAARLGSARQNASAAHFLGFVAVALAVVGVAAKRVPETARAQRPLFLGLALAGLLLSLGPRIALGGEASLPGPYALLRSFVPGFRSVRYPERFAVVLVLGLAPLVAMGLARVRSRAGPLATVALAGLVFLEHFSAPLDLIPLAAADRIPEIYRWLGRDQATRVVAEVPSPHYWMKRRDALPMYYSTAHWKRTPQGFTGYFPPAYNLIHWRLFHFPSRDSVAWLSRLGVDTIVVRPEGRSLLEQAPQPAPWTLLEPTGDGYGVLRLHAVGALVPVPGAVPGSLREVDRTGWHVKSSNEGERRAIDGDPTTLWSTTEPQQRGDFLTLRFPRPVVVARVVLDLGGSCHFPMHLRLRGETPTGTPVTLAFDEAAAYDHLSARLLSSPPTRLLEIDVAPSALIKLVLEISEDDAYGMPWSVVEVRVFEPASATFTLPVPQSG